MSVTASEARKELLSLIKKVNDDHDAIEIVSKHATRCSSALTTTRSCVKGLTSCVRLPTLAVCSRHTRTP